MFVTGFAIAAGALSLANAYKKMQDNPRQKLTDVFAELPRCVCRLRHGTEEQVPYTALCVGDVIVVHAGETVPVDGQITAGIASVDQRLLTGEAQPAEKGVGERVFAATIVLTGRICIQVDTAGTHRERAHTRTPWREKHRLII